MANEIFMPKLSSTMATGTLLQWFKEEGEAVDIGEPLFEIMTDKINIEVEAYDQGVLLKKYVAVDEEVPVNHVVGYIGKSGESVPAESPGQAGGGTNEEETSENNATVSLEDNQAAVRSLQESTKQRATPAARHLARSNKVDLVFINGSGPNGRVHKKDVVFYIESEQSSPKSTPLAQKIAAAAQVDLSTVTGSGVNGKIVKADVVHAITPQSKEADVAFDHTENRRKLSAMRKVIADRMAQSAYTAPHVTLTTEVDMSKVKELRSVLIPVVEKQTGLKISFTDILIKAAGSALSRHPQINVSIEGDEIVQHNEINIGLAVAVQDGLMVPVIKDVPAMGLAAVTKAAKNIGNRARENKLLPDQLKGSTFTISNLGMYAIDVFTPIINQPESAILGVGRIQDKPVAINNTIEIRAMMTLSLSFDHRAMDGAPAAAFLTELKQILENPFELLA
ncbi:2-oxo acid dehydrogenase subunit E2 [Niallia circulans]|uniref:Dihydrolipoamide acetyltransferase component of pyruvate dehydrogenase complex n=1 Tax=Niallia circulans TaxID=1397 RepID=A0A553SM87_NIACI|nr:2-oxo acid dehydrogenase subunit E2 [Niallia circulans]TRZ38104.1 2-oxo acid dehydrogenase subunit E2 [Niallia circulans]